MCNGDTWFGQRVRIDRHLDAALPLLLPLVDDHPVLVVGQRLGVRQLHGADEIFAEQLRRRLGRRAIVDALEIVVGPGLPSQGGRLFLLSRRPLQSSHKLTLELGTKYSSVFHSKLQ